MDTCQNVEKDTAWRPSLSGVFGQQQILQRHKFHKRLKHVWGAAEGPRQISNGLGCQPLKPSKRLVPWMVFGVERMPGLKPQRAPVAFLPL